MLALPPDADFVEPTEKPQAPSIRSAKIDALIKSLQVFDKKDKTLVFSQFTSFLDLAAGALREARIEFVRFDGSMNAKQVSDIIETRLTGQRQEVIRRFQRPVKDSSKSGNPKVMLISLKSGAVGLNLTAASNVFLCDPWWQSAIEAQAIDRVHRVGFAYEIRVRTDVRWAKRRPSGCFS